MTMYTYMEYLQKCFYKSTGWYEDNVFSNITGSSSAILDFGIPNGGKVDISSKTTDFSASSFTLSNYNVINGSLAYLYSSTPLSNTMGTKNVLLQEAISGFKVIEPNHTSYFDNGPRTTASKGTLLYGRMYFPGSALEAMVIKKFSPQTQLLVKSISNPNVAKNGTMIVYLQNNTPKFSREFVYSTNEALLGFRCLYNFGNPNTSHRFNSSLLIPKFDNSVVSIGTEIWYAAMTMSPGLSTAFRYSTRSTTTGKPLTMTMAFNPILGQMSSTYTVKTSVASTFSSKYDFNFYSYESNLSLGFELYNYSNKQPLVEANGVEYATEYAKHGTVASAGAHGGPNTDTVTTAAHKSNPPTDSPISFSPTGHNLELQRRNQHLHHKESVVTAFQNLVNESDFSSVVKFSTSLNDRMFKVLWEGRVKDFLVSTGAKITFNPQTSAPEFNKFGISFSYAN